MEPLKYIYAKPSVFSALFFAWVIPLVRHHRNIGVDKHHIPDVPEEHRFYQDYQLVAKFWEVERKTPQPSLFKAVWRSKKWEFIGGAAMVGVAVVLLVVQSVILYYLVSFLKDSTAGIGTGCALGGAFLINQLLSILLLNKGTLQLILFSSKVKSWTCMLVAEKLLVTSNTDLNSKSEAAKVTNVIGNDIELLEFLLLTCNLLFGPIVIPIAIVVLYLYMGFAGVLGMLLIVSQFPIMILLGRVTSSIRVVLAKISDSRVRIISNLIEGIKVVKLYAWEQPLLDTIFHERAREIKQFAKMCWTQIAAKVLNLGMSVASSIVAFLYYIHQGQELTPELAFFCLSILSILNLVVNYYGAMGLRFLFLILTTFRRITEVLTLEEIKPHAQADSNFKGVRVSGASFTWERTKI